MNSLEEEEKEMKNEKEVVIAIDDVADPGLSSTSLELDSGSRD
jgi:hypothetical protein